MKECLMKKLAKVAFIAVITISLAQVVWAEQVQMPRQGTTTYATNYTTRFLSSLNMGNVGSDSVAELVGTTRNTGGQKFFDGMAVRCVEFLEVRSGIHKFKGACIETDRDGDEVFSTFDSATMTHTLIGGTGKYKGISGSAAYATKSVPAPEKGSGAIVNEYKVTWQFK
jgi:hypothetical protein